jgi:hypothetical protein
VRTFIAACLENDRELREAGIPDRHRINCLVTLALGAAIT